MHVDFPVDEKALRFIESLESDPDVRALLSILLERRGKDFYNYASIICFCYREEDLMNLPDVKHLPRKVKSWIKRMSFEKDRTYLHFFKHLFSLYSSFSQTEKGWEELGKFRSVFPESYIYHRMKEKYASRKRAIVRRECFVVIDGWDSRVHRTKEEGQKIDVGTWDPDVERGECFECKVKIYIKEKEHQLEFLETIKEISKGRLSVYLASFAPKRVVLNQLRSFFPGRDLSKITILGLEEISNL